MKTAIAITALILVAGCACDDTAEIDMAIENAKLRAERYELRAYADSLTALLLQKEEQASKWALVDEITANIDKSAPDATRVLSAVVTLAQAGLFTQIGADPSLSCNGDPLTGPVDYRWQMEFTTPGVPEFIYFLTTSADSIRMRVHPIDSQGRTGCEPGVPAWSEWLEVSDGNSK